MNRVIVAAALLSASLSGCCLYNPHSHGGHFVAEYCPSAEPQISKTPYQATYVLYQWRQPPCDPPPLQWLPEQEVGELYIRGLSKWESIGFERNKDGQLFAVAGSEKLPLVEGRYCWHVSAQTRFPLAKWMIGETNNTVLGIIALPFGLVALVVFLPMLAVGGLCALPFLFLV
jgi:hypothetical protein